MTLGEVWQTCDRCKQVKRALVYLAEVVVDIEAFAAQHQNLNQLVDDGEVPLHHSDVKSSAMNP